MQADLYNMAGDVIGSVELADDVFAGIINEGLIHQDVLRQQANARQGTAATKTRGMVAGTGKKAYKQKGTGRARQGQSSAPHWRSGGVVFGPHPRSYEQDMPRKMRRAALRSALSDKAESLMIRVLDEITIPSAKTRDAVKFLDALGIDATALVVMPGSEHSVVRAVRNIPGADVIPADLLNTLSVLNHKYLVLPVNSVRKLEARLSESPERVEA
jgi:large subunit ribosomal protein L4